MNKYSIYAIMSLYTKTISSEETMYVGIDIGGTKCAVIKSDENGKIIDKIRFETTDKDETLSRIFDAVERMGECKGIGISCGGPLDEEKGLILSPPNLPGWDEVHIVEMLEARFGVPAKICNDANACAIAEWKFGAGKGTKNMIFMTFGTGLGAGLILDGKLYSGSCGFAGEIGHIRLADHGPSGYGKCGSFEGFCSGGGLRELGRTFAREYLQRGETPSFIAASSLETFTVAEMAEAARGGDRCALDAFELCGKMLGRGLAIVCDILNVETVIIGSVFARCRDLLEENAIREFRREALPAVADRVEIKTPVLDEQIGDYAAIAVAMEGER